MMNQEGKGGKGREGKERRGRKGGKGKEGKGREGGKGKCAWVLMRVVDEIVVFSACIQPHDPL